MDDKTITLTDRTTIRVSGSAIDQDKDDRLRYALRQLISAYTRRVYGEYRGIA